MTSTPATKGEARLAGTHHSAFSGGIVAGRLPVHPISNAATAARTSAFMGPACALPAEGTAVKAVETVWVTLCC